MIKQFHLQLTADESRALKIAAAQASISMNQFIRDALAEKIARLIAESKESSVPTEASEKPA
jgi:predicted HicB family RNase H-like nuclease